MNLHQQTCEWLQQLKAGDEVILNHDRQMSVRKVMRVTPKQVFVNIGASRDYEQAFWKKDGYKVGNSQIWSRQRIAMPSKDAIQEIRDTTELKALREWLSGTNFKLNHLRAMKITYDECNTKAAVVA